jgi:FAS-associated factor 2
VSGVSCDGEKFELFLATNLCRFTVITDPVADVLGFIQHFNQTYGPEHPVFYQGTYAQALNDAKRELKFLLVFLHSEASAESVAFCTRTLIQPDVVEYVNRNFFFWGCDIEKPEGYRVSHSINARRQCPTLVIVGLRANKMVVMGRMEGGWWPKTVAF